MAVVDKYIIDVKTQGAKKAHTEMGKLSATSKQLGKSLGAAAVAYFGTQGLISAINGSIAAYQQQEMAERKLQTALGRTSQALLNQASALQKVTTFGDEAIIAQQAFLGSIGFTEDKIKQLIPVALDLASATGQTLEFAVRNLAKTYSGLTGELGELIPQTKDLTAEELKAGGALQVISDLMGGSAEQNTKTMTGSLEQMTNAVGDTAESIGKFLSPSIIAGSQVLKSMAESLSNAIDNFDRFMHGGSNVVGILNEQESAMHNFKLELEDVSGNQAALIDLGNKYLELQQKEVGAVGNVTAMYFAYGEMIKLVEQEIENINEEQKKNIENVTGLNIVNNEYIAGLIKQGEQQKANEAALKEFIKLYPELAKQLKLVKDETNDLGKEERLYYASSLSGLRGMVKGKLQAYAAEMFAGLLSKEISQKGVVGIATASAGAIAAGALFEWVMGRANTISGVSGFEQGGLITGRRHSSGGELINAEGGEFVMSRNAVSAIGVENLNRMNQGQSGGGGINISINGGMISPDFVENELAESIREAVRRGADFGIS
jgi:hypothetical protein